MLYQILHHFLLGPVFIIFFAYVPLLAFLVVRAQQSVDTMMKGVEVVVKKQKWLTVNRILVCGYAFSVPLFLYFKWKLLFYETGVVMPVVLSLFIGISCYILIYYLDPMVSEIDRLHKRAVFNVLGEFTNGFDASQSDAFRERLLAGLSTEDKPIVILCSSYQHGEGKSILASSLAKSFSRIYSKVLLLELDPWCDLPNRFIPVSLRNSTLGVSDYVAELCDLQELYHAPAEESFLIMPRGNKIDNPYDMLNSPKIVSLIHENLRHFKVVIIDAPVVSLYPELNRFLTENGVMVLAVSHQTHWAEVRKLNDFVKRFDLVKRVSSVLTRVL